MFSQEQILTSDQVGYAAEEEQAMMEEEETVQVDQTIEEEEEDVTVEMIQQAEPDEEEEGEEKISSTSMDEEPEEESAERNLAPYSAATSSSNNGDDRVEYDYDDEEEEEDLEVREASSPTPRPIHPHLQSMRGLPHSRFGQGGSGGSRRPVVVVRAAPGGGYVSAPKRMGGGGGEGGRPSVGQYVMRGGQMVRIGSHPVRQSSSGATFLATAGSGSPVKGSFVVRIMPEVREGRPPIGKGAYQRHHLGSGQSMFVQQSQASPTTQTHSGTVIIKDPKSSGYKAGNQIQYVRLVQASAAQPSQGSNVKSGLKPIMPFTSKPPTPGGPVVIHSPQESTSVAEHCSVPPATAIIVKKKSLLGNRKPCNCTKSMCLKLYCDCFANGEFCRNCNCKDCHNNLENDDERSKAIKSSLERNPNAFQPKIGKTGRSEVDRMHQKGCHCKKSSCLKNYCECYEAKVSCTVRCKCVGCRNTEQDRLTKGIPRFSSSSGLLHLANAASSASAELCRSESPLSEPSNELRDPKTQPWYYMTDEVVECTTLCLVAQAEELERTGVKDEGDMEKAILKEFGRCLQQIIHNANAASSSSG